MTTETIKNRFSPVHCTHRNRQQLTANMRQYRPGAELLKSGSERHGSRTNIRRSMRLHQWKVEEVSEELTMIVDYVGAE